MVTDGIRRRLTGVRTIRPVLRLRWWLVVPGVLLLLGLGGVWIRSALERSVKASTRESLLAILDANVSALELWFADQRSLVAVLAEAEQVRRPALALARSWSPDPALRREADAHAALEELRTFLTPTCLEHGYRGFVVVAPDGTIIGRDDDASIGTRIAPERFALLASVLLGRTIVSQPFVPQAAVARDEPDRPVMVVAGPIGDEAGHVQALLALFIDPERDFTRLLETARVENTGETYAFSREGLLLSHSRFDDQLRSIGLIPPDPGSRALLALEIRDPGGDLLRGHRPALPRAEQPLTEMAAAAVAGRDGVDVEGYRDYRGVLVAGAWKWLDDYGIGVASEIDHAEALAMPAELRRIFWTVLGVFVLIGGVGLAAARLVSRMGEQMDDALAEARKLGQYTLEEKLGEGGMGQVFRARHAMLRRPTAIKLLHPDRASAEDLARFEREVQITSRLTHPNTIAIFDYGRTPEGVFYYAMEYLPGIDLGRLVALDGAQPQGRVIHILRQVCGSLAEAHAHGLIHRDVKPENVILCERGGRHDVAKVLDFGIVKDTTGADATRLTRVDSFSGTPLYVAPEAWSAPDRVDARADLYALGAVGYYLLTGHPVFDGKSAVEIYDHHVRTNPAPPSRHAPILPELERLILRCLEKNRERRPRAASELERELDACAAAAPWSEDEARRWWERHAHALQGSAGAEEKPAVGDAVQRTSYRRPPGS